MTTFLIHDGQKVRHEYTEQYQNKDACRDENNEVIKPTPMPIHRHFSAPILNFLGAVHRRHLDVLKFCGNSSTEVNVCQ